MTAHIEGTAFRTVLAVAALTVFHSARPLAVSAQGRATISVSATVVRPDAAWTGHELTRAVLRATAAATGGAMADDTSVRASGAEVVSGGSVARAERNGTVVWVQPSRADDRTTRVMVAHLGS